MNREGCYLCGYTRGGSTAVCSLCDRILKNGTEDDEPQEQEPAGRQELYPDEEDTPVIVADPSVTWRIQCDECGGTGHNRRYTLVSCFRCSGRGWWK